MIRDAVRAIGGGDVDLNHDKVRFVVEPQPLDVLVLDLGLVVLVEVGSKGGKAQRREQRILDRPPERAGRLGQRGEYQLDPHSSP